MAIGMWPGSRSAHDGAGVCKKVEFVVKEKDFAGKGARAFRQTLPLQK